MGQLRAPHIAKSARVSLECVVDVHEPTGRALADKYGVPWFPSIDDAVTAITLNAVWIASPTPAHSPSIRAAAANKLAVFTEKPVAFDIREIVDLFQICADAKVPLCCGFQRRFDPTYQAVQKAVEAGQIGLPNMGYFFFGDHPAPAMEFLKQGGDIILDCGPHDIDYMRWVLNDEVEEVFGQGTSSCPELAECGVLDSASVFLRFKKGAMVTLQLSRFAKYGYDQRCEFFGPGGLVKADNQQKNNAVLIDGSGVHGATLKHSFPQRFAEAFEGEIEAFAATVLDGELWPVSKDDCIAVQAIAEAASESCKQNGKMMRLDLSPQAVALRVGGATQSAVSPGLKVHDDSGGAALVFHTDDVEGAATNNALGDTYRKYDDPGHCQGERATKRRR